MKIKKISNILTFVIIVLLVVIGILIKNIYDDIKSSKQEEVKIIETIDNYNYELNENDTELFRKEFSNLKDILNSEEIDFEKYAESIAKLFVIDFYSLDAAINKNDVGGVQFIGSDYQEMFILKAKDTIYSHIENNIYGKRTQELPNVKEVTVSDVSKTTFDKKDAYLVELNIIYDVDLGYPSSVKVTLINEDNILNIGSVK